MPTGQGGRSPEHPRSVVSSPASHTPGRGAQSVQSPQTVPTGGFSFPRVCGPGSRNPGISAR